MLSFSRKLNEIAVTSYKSTSLTVCVRLSNQLRKILIFFSLWNYGWDWSGSKFSEFISPSSGQNRIVCTKEEKILILHWLRKPKIQSYLLCFKDSLGWFGLAVWFWATYFGLQLVWYYVLIEHHATEWNCWLQISKHNQKQFLSPV